MDIKNFKFLESDSFDYKVEKYIVPLHKELLELLSKIENQQLGSASTSNNVIPSNSLLESIETGDLFSQG